MDIERIWQKNPAQDEVFNQLLQQDNFHNLPSKHPLSKLRRNLLMSLVWATVITGLYVWLLFYFDFWQAYITLAVLILFNATIMFDTWRLYKRTPAAVLPTHSVKEELMIHYDSFHRWWYLQQRISLFVYPIACTGGFIIGGIIGSGKPMEAFLYNSKMLGLLAITLVVLVPLSYFGARWMFNYAFGIHLKRLKATIDELK